MPQLDESIDVAVPLWAAYEEWTDVANWSRFMGGVHEVRSLGGGRIAWRGDAGGADEEWEAVLEQVEEERVAWHSVSGPRNDGEVTFLRMDDTTTEVRLRLDVDADAPGAGLGSGLERRVRDDLAAFKRHVEAKHAGRGWHDPKEDSVVDR